MLPTNTTNSVEAEREYAIVKANALVRKAHFNLSLQEQKLILYCISKIKPNDNELQEYQFDLRNLCAVCGIELHGQNYQNFKDTIKSLRDKSFWIETEREEILCSWIQHARIVKHDTIVKIRLDEALRPYLLQMRENFTQYSLKHILAMSSKYSIRLFELLQSHAYSGQVQIALEDMKSLLQTANYPVYADFRRNVVEPALKEINKYTYLNVSFEPIRKNRKIAALLFTIGKKTNILSRLAADAEREKILNPST